MPFKKVGTDDYTSPSGRHFNSAQVRLYYAHGGSFPGQHKQEGGPVYAKGSKPQDAHYAEGGAVLGRTVNFMKVPDEFRNPDEGKMGDSADEDQKYAKSGLGAGKGFIKPPAAKGKCLTPVKPRT